MSFWSTPINLAFSVLAIFLTVGVFIFAKFLLRKISERRGELVFEISPQLLNKEGIKSLLDNVKLPFALEVAVHQLGKEVHYYLTVPKVSGHFVKEKLNAKLAQEYNVYHSGGNNLGFNLKGSDILPLVNLRDIDFSSINEVGEGALVQLIIGGRNQEGWLVNFRVLVSAPTAYQAHEIVLTLNSSLPKFKPMPVNMGFAEFLNKANFREFDQKEAMVWSN